MPEPAISPISRSQSSLRQKGNRSTSEKSRETKVTRSSRAENAAVDAKLPELKTLLEPNGLLLEMEALDRIGLEHDRRHDETSLMIFNRIYRNSFVAVSSPETLTEFLRHPHWNGRVKKPAPDDHEGILRALFSFHLRHKPKPSARSALHTSLSAARELLIRKVTPSNALEVLNDTEGGIAGLRNAFKLRRSEPSSVREKESGSDGIINANHPICIPILTRGGLSWRNFNDGELHLVFDDGCSIHYIPENYLKTASKN